MTRPRPAMLALWSILVVLVTLGAWSGGRPADQAVSETPSGPATQEDPAGALPDEAQVAPAEAPPPSSQLQVRVPRGNLGTGLAERSRALLGIAVLLLLAWTVSVNRRKVPWRIVAWGMSLQLIFAVIILRSRAGGIIFDGINSVIVQLLGYTVEGASFVFGNLVNENVPVGTGSPAGGGFTELPGQVANVGAQFAFSVLPTIIFFSSLMTVLYHLGVMQLLVRGVAYVMRLTMRTSGAETMSAAANIFVGQTEAPLIVKPFVGTMTRSELMAVMTGGFATVAGGVLAAYVGILLTYFPDVAGHLIAASVMSAPAALVVAKLMYPEEEKPATAGSSAFNVERPDVNVIDAAARGAGEGLTLAMNVGAMLLAFIALVHLGNGLLGWVGGLIGLDGITLEAILGWVLSPLTWLMGVPWEDATQVASLLGVKTVLNEFVAYFQLAGALAVEGDGLHPRSVVIATYALSGFANFSSIAIQLGGIGGIAPERRADLAALGLRAMVGGTIAAFLTATVAGMLL